MYFSDDVNFRMNYRMSFDCVSSSYHEARPEYPAEMYRDIADIVGFKDSNLKFSNILEVGSGSGQATNVLSQLASTVLDCIEPGENFVNLLSSRFKDNPIVNIHQSTFEYFNTAKKYDLIFSGCALHWIEKEVAYERSIELLNNGGWLMAVWNMPQFTDEIYTLINRNIIPFEAKFDIPKGTPERLENFDHGLDDFSNNRGFINCMNKIYYTKRHLSAKDLVDLIWSYVNISILGESNSDTVYQSLIEAVCKLGKDSYEVKNCYPFVAGQKEKT